MYRKDCVEYEEKITIAVQIAVEIKKKEAKRIKNLSNVLRTKAGKKP